VPVALTKLSKTEASVFAALVFVITIALTFFLPQYTITLSGLLVVIFLSVFVPDRGSTIVATLVSAAVVVFFMIWQSWNAKVLQTWTEHLFILSLIFFACLIVLYIKRLITNMQMDKSHMTSLFENATEGIVVTDGLGSIILVNPSAIQMFGYRPDELVGEKIEILIPHQYRKTHVALRDEFYLAPKNRVMGHGRDLHGQRRDGTTFPVEVSLSTYSQSQSRYVIAFIVDITHRKEIEKNIAQQQQQLEAVTNDIRKLNTDLEAKVEERTIILKEALQRLEESQRELSEALDKERELSEIKSRFVSMASHEFRTPLSTVLSSASLLSKYITTEDQEKRNRHIEKIKASVKHLNDLLEDFLSLGKLDEGKVGTSFDLVNLHEVIQDTVDEMKGLAKKDQHIEYEHLGKEIIESDKKLLKNILINLVGNAIKFSDEGNPIYVHSTVADGTATVSVKDEGLGISEEDQQHLFSSFFRGRNATNIQGTGLGLHIVKRYLDLLGGEVFLKSELGKGTTITFTIPVKYSANGENNSGN
jgi:PAS domain S-box-containing protein